MSIACANCLPGWREDDVRGECVPCYPALLWPNLELSFFSQLDMEPENLALQSLLFRNKGAIRGSMRVGRGRMTWGTVIAKKI